MTFYFVSFVIFKSVIKNVITYLLYVNYPSNEYILTNDVFIFQIYFSNGLSLSREFSRNLIYFLS